LQEKDTLEYSIATEELNLSRKSLGTVVFIKMPEQSAETQSYNLNLLRNTLYEIFQHHTHIVLLILALFEHAKKVATLEITSENLTISGEYDEADRLLVLLISNSELLQRSQLEWDTHEIKHHLRN
jgi:hypothetical protein